MEKKILNLICDYSNNGKVMDNEFVEAMIGTVITCNNLSEYLDKIFFVDDSIPENAKKVRVAEYNFIDRILNININSMKIYLAFCQNRYAQGFSKTEQNLFDYYLVSQAILHELEHVNQNKKYNINNQDDESVLINMSASLNYLLKDPIAFFNKLHKAGYDDNQINNLLEDLVAKYKKYYSYNPNERMAEINAYNYMKKIIIPICDDIPNIYLYNSYKYHDNLTNGYCEYKGRLIPPTEIYMEGMGYQYKLTEFSFYDNNPDVMKNKLFDSYSDVERLKYGFDVTKEEYSGAIKKLNICGNFR